MKRAIYAGSFDPVTFGHLEIVKKAIDLFDYVYVMVAHNPQKTHMFTLQERMEMMKDAVSCHDNVAVGMLPFGETVAHKARKMEVTHLVRGLRGHTDLDSEMVNARINKEVNNQLETVIFIPDIDVEELSSSIVRSIVGLRNWRDILAKRVPSSVIGMLQDKHFQSLLGLDNESWFYLKDRMNRPYHNLSHAYEVMNLVYYDIEDDMEKKAVALAAAYHDIESSEEESYQAWALRYRTDHDRNKKKMVKRVHDLILATDHSKPLTEEQLKDVVLLAFVCADLMVLASAWETYQTYIKNVRLEYTCTDEEWKKGRSDFLNKMIKKESIFPSSGIESACGDKARQNMRRELKEL